MSKHLGQSQELREEGEILSFFPAGLPRLSADLKFLSSFLRSSCCSQRERQEEEEEIITVSGEMRGKKEHKKEREREKEVPVTMCRTREAEIDELIIHASSVATSASKGRKG